MFGKINKSVLLVEDDLLLREVLQTQIENAGYRVHSVINGSNVLIMAKKHLPNLIVLDLAFSGLDGFYVLKELRAVGELAKIPVVVLADSSKESTSQATAAFGVRECIMKAGANMDDIVTAIKRNIKE